MFLAAGAASRIAFSNGLLDPWHGGGVLEDVNPQLPALIIPEVRAAIMKRNEITTSIMIVSSPLFMLTLITAGCDTIRYGLALL